MSALYRDAAGNVLGLALHLPDEGADDAGVTSQVGEALERASDHAGLLLWAHDAEGGDYGDFCDAPRPRGLGLPAAQVRASMVSRGSAVAELGDAVARLEAVAVQLGELLATARELLRCEP